MVSWGEVRCRTQWEHNDLGMPRNDRLRRSLLEFQERFPDQEACAADLSRLHWPAGFVCPACGSSRGWALATKAHTHECADCRKLTSVMAGTVMHGSKLALTAWFWAAYPMATHSNWISALQLQKQFGLGGPRDRMVAHPQAAPGHGRAAAHAAGGLGRGGRKPDRLPLQGRPAERRRQAQPPRQAASCWSLALPRSARVGPVGSAWRGSRTSPPAACTPSWAPTSPSAPRPEPTAGLATPARPASHTTHTSLETWPPMSRPALGLSRLRQPQDLGAGRLLRPPTQTPAIPSRRVRLPLQPAPIPPRRLPLHPRHQRRNQAGNLQHADRTGATGISLCRHSLLEQSMQKSHCQL